MSTQLCPTCQTKFPPGSLGEKPLLNLDAYSSTSAKQRASELIQDEIINLENKVQGLERLIFEYQEQILSWKSQQNKLCGVSALPDDILLDIWAYLAADAGESAQTMLDWLNITYVCSHWRKLALKTPALWRWPCLSCPTLAPFLLERAIDIPLILHVDFDQLSYPYMAYEAVRKAFDLAGQLLHRTQSLTLRAFRNMCSYFKSDNVVLPLRDRAKECLIRLETIMIEYTAFPPPNPNEVDINVLIQMVPGIRKVTLRNTTLFDSPWPLRKPLSNLVYLDITNHNEASQAPLRSVLSTLEMLPNLVSLLLLGVFSPLEDEDWCRIYTQPIPLKSLQELHIATTGLELAHSFLCNITHPADTQITVYFSLDAIPRESDTPERNMFHTFLRIIVDRIGRPIRSLCVGRETGMYDVSFDPERDSRMVGPRVRLYWPEIRPEFITYIPDACSLQELELLYCYLDESNTDLWKGFGSLPKLERIQNIWVDEEPAFVKVLSIFRPSDDSIFEPISTPTVPQLYFPSLITDTLQEPGLELSVQEEMKRVVQARKAWVEAGQDCGMGCSSVVESSDSR